MPNVSTGQKAFWQKSGRQTNNARILNKNSSEANCNRERNSLAAKYDKVCHFNVLHNNANTSKEKAFKCGIVAQSFRSNLQNVNVTLTKIADSVRRAGTERHGFESRSHKRSKRLVYKSDY